MITICTNVEGMDYRGWAEIECRLKPESRWQNLGTFGRTRSERVLFFPRRRCARGWDEEKLLMSPVEWDRGKKTH